MRRVLITGCSTGIGRETATLLTSLGYEVVATARDVNAIEDLDVAHKAQLDVTDSEQVRDVVRAAEPLDVLVNNAGYSVWAPIETVPLADAQRLVDTNVFGAVRMIQAVLPGMRARGRGTVVNVSSTAGRTGGAPLIGWYAMSKHALEVVTESLRLEIGHLGVDVILIEPGAVASAFPQNRVVAGVDVEPYATMASHFFDRIAASRTEPFPASGVADVIASALATPQPRLRWLAGPDAAALVERRSGMTDDEIERQVRAQFGLDC
ncbi:MAG: SDR family oxidoreductase [Ilumatobacteraceae bacterium]